MMVDLRGNQQLLVYWVTRAEMQSIAFEWESVNAFPISRFGLIVNYLMILHYQPVE